MSEVESEREQESVKLVEDTADEEDIKIIEDGFGIIEEGDEFKIIRRFTFINKNCFMVQVISYGARIISIKYPDKYGVTDDVVLGYETLDGYMEECDPYFGATVGRVANRNRRGLFTERGDQSVVRKHRGFDNVTWDSMIQGDKVKMTYMSRSQEEGYPSDLTVVVIYSITTDNELNIEIQAMASLPTPVNICNRTYFNLAGHGTGAATLHEHVVQINADRVILTDDKETVSGIKNVTGSVWDLRMPVILGNVLKFVPYGGYDQNLCVCRTHNERTTFVARVYHPDKARYLEVYSNQPDVHFDTANFLPWNPNLELNAGLCCEGVKGKKGCMYYKHQGFCMQTQSYSDSTDQTNFPNVILKPGRKYRHLIVYKFGLVEDAIFVPCEYVR